MLSRIRVPGLFITGTDTDVGKTVVAASIADWFRRSRLRVAVSKPFATGCVRRREGLVSEDAELLATSANARYPLDMIAPQRWLEPLAPAIAAQRSGVPVDWEAIDRSLQMMSADSDVIVVEGVGGLRVPLDPKTTVLDLVKWLDLPVVVVSRATLGTINHTLLTVDSLRRENARIAGVVINRYPPDGASVAEESNPGAIEKWGKVPVLCLVPNEKITPPAIPPGITAAIDQVDWSRLAGVRC